MNLYHYPNEGYAPSASTLFRVAAGWLTVLAAGTAFGLINSAGGSNQVAGLLIAVGAAVAAGAFVLLALRVQRRERANVPLELHAQAHPLAGSPKQLDDAA